MLRIKLNRPVDQEVEVFREIDGFRGAVRWYKRGKHFYVACRKSRQSVYVRCYIRKCPARFVLRDGVPGPLMKNHDHEPTPWIENRNLMYQALKLRVKSEPTNSLRQIYNEEKLRHPQGGQYLRFNSVVSSMRFWRRNALSDISNAVEVVLQSHSEKDELLARHSEGDESPNHEQGSLLPDEPGDHEPASPCADEVIIFETKSFTESDKIEPCSPCPGGTSDVEPPSPGADEIVFEVNCDDETDNEQEVPFVERTGYKCNACAGDIIGFRYACVQCADFELCSSCEKLKAHAAHYLLRIPARKSLREACEVLRLVRAGVARAWPDLGHDAEIINPDASRESQPDPLLNEETTSAMEDDYSGIRGRNVETDEVGHYSSGGDEPTADHAAAPNESSRPVLLELGPPRTQGIQNDAASSVRGGRTRRGERKEARDTRQPIKRETRVSTQASAGVTRKLPLITIRPYKRLALEMDQDGRLKIVDKPKRSAPDVKLVQVADDDGKIVFEVQTEDINSVATKTEGVKKES